MDKLRERLAQCFRIVFPNLKSDAEAFAASQATLPEWDSVATIMLVNVVEEEFQVQMDFEVIEELTSFDLVLGYLRDPLKGIKQIS
jgi:acyl carrier protein